MHICCLTSHDRSLKKFRQNTVFPSHLASTVPKVTAWAVQEKTCTGSLKQLPINNYNLFLITLDSGCLPFYKKVLENPVGKNM